jgi:hypothetical protein
MAVITNFEPYLLQTSSVLPVQPVTFNTMTASNPIFAALTQTNSSIPVTPINPNQQVNFRDAKFTGGSARITEGLSITDATNTIDLGANATVELWLWADELPTAASNLIIPIIAKRNNTSTSPPNWLFLYFDSNGYLTLQVSSASVAGAWGLSQTGTRGISPASWNHIAIVRQTTSTWTVYLNGQFYLSGTVAGAINNTTTTLVLGAADSTRSVIGTIGILSGYIDGLRINTTTAVYTSAFAPTYTIAPTVTQDANVYNNPSAAIASGTVLVFDPQFGGTFSDLTGTVRTFTGGSTHWLTPFEGAVSGSGIAKQVDQTNKLIPVTNIFPFTQTIGGGGTTVSADTFTEMWI